jgi:tetratricopeptide (TPR) repeat protein
MALNDSRGVPVSTRDTRALADYETTAELLHGYYGDPLALLDATLARTPDFVMGHCLRAAMAVIATERAALPVLEQSVVAAEALAARANPRERGHIAAARAWLDGDLEKAAALYGAILFEYPRDSLALQVAQLCDFYLGHSAMLRDRIARVLPSWDEGVPGYSYVLGMHAFGLEETGDYLRAERTGRRAIDLQPRDPWAAHAVAHVMEMQGRVADGIAWLDATSRHWAEDNGFAYHNWWHLALFHLDRADDTRVLALYDGVIRPRPSRVVLEMIDASSLLWRLLLRNVDVGDRWTELADAWADVAGDAYYPFNDVHATMAFVGAGRNQDARDTLNRLQRRAQEGGTAAMMSGDVGVPLCRGIMAFGQGDYRHALDDLLRAQPIAHRFGGSHAQRDVIALTAVEAALRGGCQGVARALIGERRDLKPDSAANRQLERRLRVSGRELDINSRASAQDGPVRLHALV